MRPLYLAERMLSQDRRQRGRKVHYIGQHVENAAMRLEVELQPGDDGIEMPRRIYLDGRKVEVIENLDQWHGHNHSYVKVRGDDGNLYILRLDEGRSEWELTMFQRPGA